MTDQAATLDDLQTARDALSRAAYREAGRAKQTDSAAATAEALRIHWIADYMGVIAQRLLAEAER